MLTIKLYGISYLFPAHKKIFIEKMEKFKIKIDMKDDIDTCTQDITFHITPVSMQEAFDIGRLIESALYNSKA